MKKIILGFILGFAVGCAWLIFDPRITITTPNKIIATWETAGEEILHNMILWEENECSLIREN